MKLLNFTIIKLTLCLCIGIVTAHFISIPTTTTLMLVLGSTLALAISYIASNRRIQRTYWFGCLAFSTTVCVGILVYTLHDQRHFQSHYSRHISSEKDSLNSITFRIREKQKPNNFHHKYIIDVLKVNDVSVTGKSLMNVQIDSTTAPLKVDDILNVSASFDPLNPPLNPHQFDYKSYLEKQYIHHQIFTKSPLIYTVSSQRSTLFGFAEELRTTINAKLRQYPFKPDELAIINALLLGQRQDISEEIYNSYINAGAIHILAVSGLHVGIVLLLLSFVLRPMEYFKYGKIAKVLLLLLTLWSFAIIAGLSASVTRAVTMFSIVAIAMHWKRPTNIYNTLAISVFILLLFKPMFLFDVGFQLSYLAVLAIVIIQPLLYKLWKPRFKPIDFLWQIFTVTIAAQIGVVPISLYYFHQFPSLFFVSNLIIIPCLGVILAYGIIVIIFALMNILPAFVATLYGQIISAMNGVVRWVSQQEQYVFKDISINMLQMLMGYLLIATFLLFYKYRKFRSLALFLVSILMFQGIMIYTSYENASNQFIVFHKNRYTLIGEKHHSKLKVSHNFDSIAKANDHVITNFKIGNFIDEFEVDSVKSVYQIHNKTLLVIDSLGIYNVKSFRPNYLLLRNSPKLNLKRVIDSMQPELIIADGSNYNSYVVRWEKTCAELKLPFHQTGKKGAFIIK